MQAQVKQNPSTEEARWASSPTPCREAIGLLELLGEVELGLRIWFPSRLTTSQGRPHSQDSLANRNWTSGGKGEECSMFGGKGWEDRGDGQEILKE